VSFMLVDKIVEQSSTRMVTRKMIARTAWPTLPPCAAESYPSVLILEGLAQTGGWLIKLRHDFLTLAIMSIVENAEILAPVVAGDALDYEVCLLTDAEDFAVAKGEASCRGNLILKVEKILYYCRSVTTEEINWGKVTFESLVR
jgi:3-hydroxymyristoyl/3-hydroxydecanoyl-(acyl carrier protein) dehydratase